MLFGVGVMFNISKQWLLHVEGNYIILANNTTENGIVSYLTTVNNSNVLMVGAEFNF